LFRRLDLAQKYVDAYLGRNSTYLFNNLRELQAVASSIAQNEVLAPVVTWNDDHSVASMYGIDVTMINIRAGNHKALNMLKDLAVQLAKVKNPWDMVMAPSNLHISPGSGGCLFDDPLLHDVVGRKNPVLREWAASFAEGTSGSRWNITTLSKFLELSATFWRILCVLLFITSGPPPRTPDFVALTLTDGHLPAGVQRRDNQWVLNFRHGKLLAKMIGGFWTCGFVPECMDTLVSWAILHLRPAEIIISRYLSGDSGAALYRDHFFVADQTCIGEVGLSRHLKSYTSHFWSAGTGLGSADWRQLASSLTFEFTLDRDLALTIFGSEASNQSFGHGEIAHNSHYNRSHRDDGAPTAMYSKFQLNSRQWTQITLPTSELPAAVHIRPLPDISRRGARMAALGANPTHIQSVSTIHSRKPAFDYIDRAFEVFTEQMRRSHLDMYKQFLGVVEDRLDDHHRDHKVKSVINIRDNERYTEVVTLLRKAMKNPLLQPRPGQSEVLMHLRGTARRNMVAVLPCGSGKSATFLVPAATWESNMVHLLVVPTTALVNQFKTTARGLGIAAWDYTHDHPDLHTIRQGIIIVTPENLKLDSVLLL
jgi:hypothetical protein